LLTLFLLYGFNATLALAKIKDETAIPHLAQKAEKEPLEEVMMAVIQALTDFGPTAIEPLIKLTNSSKPLVRMAACQGLGRIDTHKSVEPLIRSIDDPDPNVRRAAICANFDTDSQSVFSLDFTDR